MKKERTVLIVFVAILAIYFLCLTLFLILKPNSIFVNFWFTNLLLFLSVFLFVKTIIFPADSTLFLASFLSLIGITNYLVALFLLDEKFRWLFYVLAISVCFLAVFVKFKNKFYCFCGSVLFLICIPIFLWSISCINTLTMILLICIIFCIAIISIVTAMKKRGE